MTHCWVTFEKIPEGSGKAEKAWDADLEEKIVTGRGNNRCKGPEARAHLGGQWLKEMFEIRVVKEISRGCWKVGQDQIGSL